MTKTGSIHGNLLNDETGPIHSNFHTKTGPILDRRDWKMSIKNPDKEVSLITRI